MRKIRICKNCKSVIYAKGMCRYHYYRQLQLQTRQKKKYKPIRKVSKKTASNVYHYSRLRKKFLKHSENQVCKARLEGCTVRNEITIHHSKGRLGTNFLDTTTWVSLCLNCHRIIEADPQLAYEMGLSQKRNT